MQETYGSNWSPGPLFWIACGIFALFEIASWWRVFEKAGKPGWACLIPIYNSVVMLQIAGRPWWWIFLYMIPLVNIIIAIMVMVDFAKSFGKGVGFALGIIFVGFIFIPILAWGEAQYLGPAAGTPPPA